MRFEAVLTKAGRQCFVDGYPVSEAVYDTLFPSRMFPVDTGLSLDEAESVLAAIKAETPPPDDNGFLHHQPAIRSDKPLRSNALACHTSQIPAIMARNAKHGLQIKYDRVGRPVITSEGERRKLMAIESKVMGAKIVNLNSYNGH